ncbi:MAG: peptide chain release factor N(5)-glutamine methyltransferase [Planctomycetes bacterium]|nr:peptide chain release factor N(5)-glutamine methyltransferase [Planctomycetota bacterium]
MASAESAGDPVGAVHTVGSVQRGAAQWLEARGIEAPQRSAELLLGKVLGMSRLELYLAFDRPLSESERTGMRGLLRRRGNGEPVAHLLGSWSFRGHELEVSPAVLVPRPETEDLVSIALERTGDLATAIDLGTGSGAIAIALAIERPALAVTAVDLSENALAIARRNAARHGVADRIRFLRGSWWQSVPADARFDLVISNPPYIDPHASDDLAADVRAFEPPLALFSAAGDPASCYREIAAGLERHLVPGGWFLAETGIGASDAALAALDASGQLAEIALEPDSAGIDRFLIGRRR